MVGIMNMENKNGVNLLALTFGTAGHIDHGKTALVRALTGIDTDRLKAEKERGITIELGYAYLDLPPFRIGLVDVPGHEKLVRTMIAGASGLDVVLFVLSADEGIKPQSLEHLRILTYMGIDKGILVLTKADLATVHRREEVREAFYEAAKGSFMENAPYNEVSAKTGEGVEALKALMKDCASSLEERIQTRSNVSVESFRMPIDRLFQLNGVGTIAAGTITEGSVLLGLNLMHYPSQKLCKVRGLQVHHEKAEVGHQGERAALNVTGLNFEDLSRGDVLAAPDSLSLTDRFEAKITLALDASVELRHYSRLRVYLGAKELLCRIVLVDREVLSPGESAYVQIKLEESFVCRTGDYFVLRTYSPILTIGGGQVSRVNSKQIRRKELAKTIAKDFDETSATEETLEKMAFTFYETGRLPTVEMLAKATGQSESITLERLQILRQNEKVSEVLEGWLSNGFIESLGAKIVEGLGDFHRKYPLSRGMGKEALRARIIKACRVKIFDELLNIYLKKDMIVIQGQSIALRTFQIRLSREQQKKEERFIRLLKDSGLTLKTATELSKMAGFDQKDQGLLSYILEGEDVVGLEEGLVIHRTWLGDAKSKLEAYLEASGSIDAAGYRDLLQTNRKVSIALLEYFDATGLTMRVDNKRQLK